MGNGQDTLSSSVDPPSEESPRHSTLKTQAASDSVGEPRVEQIVHKNVEETIDIEKKQSPSNVRPLKNLSGVDEPKADQRAVQRTATATEATNSDEPMKEQVSSYSISGHHSHSSSETISVNEHRVAELNVKESDDINEPQKEQSLQHSTDKSSTETIVGTTEPQAKQTEAVQNVRDSTHTVAINTMINGPPTKELISCSETSEKLGVVEHRLNIVHPLTKHSPCHTSDSSFANVDEPQAASQTVSLTTTVVMAINKPPKEQSPCHTATGPSLKTLSIREPSTRHQNVQETVQAKAPNEQSLRHSTSSSESLILGEYRVQVITGDVVEPLETVKPRKEQTPHHSIVRSYKTFVDVLDEPQAKQIAVQTLPEQKTEPTAQKTLAAVKEWSPHHSDITTSKKISGLDETQTSQKNVQETTTVVATIDNLQTEQSPCHSANDRSFKTLSVDESLTEHQTVKLTIKAEPPNEQRPSPSTTYSTILSIDKPGIAEERFKADHEMVNVDMSPREQSSCHSATDPSSKNISRDKPQAKHQNDQKVTDIDEPLLKEQSPQSSVFKSSKIPCSTLSVELEAKQGAVQDIKQSSAEVVDIDEPSDIHGSLHSATSKALSLDEPHVNVKEVDLGEPQIKQSHSHATTDQFSKNLQADKLETKCQKVDIEEPRLKEESLHLSTSNTLSVEEPQLNERNLKVKVKAVGPSITTHMQGAAVTCTPNVSTSSGPLDIVAASGLQNEETEKASNLVASLSLDTATLLTQVDVVPYSVNTPITPDTVPSSAVNVAIDDLQVKSKLIGNETETASEPEVPPTARDTAGPLSLGGSGTTLETGHSQDSPWRISRKKKQGQTRLNQRHGES